MRDGAGSRGAVRCERNLNGIVNDTQFKIKRIPQPVRGAVVIETVAVGVCLWDRQLEGADFPHPVKLRHLGAAFPVVAGEIVKDNPHPLAVQQDSDAGNKGVPDASAHLAAQGDLNGALLENGTPGEGFGVIQKAVRTGNIQIKGLLDWGSNAVVVPDGKAPVPEGMIAFSGSNHRNGGTVCHGTHRYTSCAARMPSCRFMPGASLPTRVLPSR